jgi:hypothetical protein
MMSESSKMKMLLTMLYAMLLLVAPMFLIVINAPTVKAQPVITAYVEPSNIVLAPENATLGYQFNVTVWINSTEAFNLMMWQVFLSFDDSIIMFNRGWPNMALSDWDPEYVFYGKTGMAADPHYYTASGSPIGLPGVMLGHTLLMNVSITESPKKVCALEFNVTKVADGLPFTCALGINNAQTFFYHSSGQIEVTLIDGNYSYVPEFQLTNLLVLMLAISVIWVVRSKIKSQKWVSAIKE